MKLNEIELNIIQDRNVTAAEVVMPVYIDDQGEATISMSGSAKREPGEPFDSFVGECLAVGRALKSMGEALELAGWQILREIEAENPPQRIQPPQSVLEQVAQETTQPKKEVRTTRLSKQAAAKLAKRNQRIRKDWDAGWTAQYLAEKYNLSLSYVYQIVKAAA